MQNWVKIGRCAAELLGIFDFQNGGRPPSWIWYDVIADHPRFVFDGPNIVLKLHIDCANIWQDIAIFITYFRGILGDMRGSPWNWVPVQWVKQLECWGYQMVEKVLR